MIHDHDRIIFKILLLLKFFTLVQTKPTIEDQQSNISSSVNTDIDYRISHCLNFIPTIDCYYYACVDAKYQCGSENILVRFSYDFCEMTTKIYHDQFTDAGQYWIKQMQTCVMKKLNDRFHGMKHFKTCTQLQSFVYNLYPNCFFQPKISTGEKSVKLTKTSICSIICENIEQLISIFDNINKNSINLIPLILETGRLCEATTEKIITDISTAPLSALLISICLDRKDVRLASDISKLMLSSREAYINIQEEFSNNT
ncbi:unnamed protein product [Didymodactylos carnosus]|uniref:Uncharacterized protein n=1 Tax=Didymodactylos carnosus TaxID=1234261 RepID=A0A8S2DH62_9BILA|nr:unnamed protein product [Didymodactylos carnosus]CAF3704161.1 unnamed protein product [Didymodactylos carnosus]